MKKAKELAIAVVDAIKTSHAITETFADMQVALLNATSRINDFASNLKGALEK